MVRPITLATYEFQSRYVVGPLPPGEARRAIIASGRRREPKVTPIELLGREKVQELTTRRVRAWHKLISDEVSIYCANKAHADSEGRARAGRRGSRVPTPGYADGPPAPA